MKVTLYNQERMSCKLALSLASQPVQGLDQIGGLQLAEPYKEINSALLAKQIKLEILAQDRPALEQVFDFVNADSCPYNYNFHLHTVNSDGQLKPEELMRQAIDLGLQGLAITDHHSIKGYQKAVAWLAEWTQANPTKWGIAPRLWTGVEINAKLLETEVHILGYAFNPNAPSIQPYLEGKSIADRDQQAYQAISVIEAIHQAQGIAVLAHPARYRQSPKDLIPAAVRLGIDGLETYYAYDHPHPWRTSPKQTKQVEDFRDTFGLFGTCGTDTHGTNILMRL